MTCAAPDFIGIPSTKLVILQEATNRYLKLSIPFDMNLMSTDKLFICDKSAGIPW